MTCTTCGQNASTTSTVTYASTGASTSNCNCPTLSNPPTCNELKDLKSKLDNQIATNREFVTACSGASILNYVDSYIEKQQCLMGHIIDALCAKANK